LDLPDDPMAVDSLEAHGSATLDNVPSRLSWYDSVSLEEEKGDALIELVHSFQLMVCLFNRIFLD
jgi:hypothetical protein